MEYLRLFEGAPYPFLCIIPPSALSKLPLPQKDHRRIQQSWWLGRKISRVDDHKGTNPRLVVKGLPHWNPTASVHLVGHILPALNFLALFPKSLVVGVCSYFKRSHQIELLPDNTPNSSYTSIQPAQTIETKAPNRSEHLAFNIPVAHHWLDLSSFLGCSNFEALLVTATRIIAICSVLSPHGTTIHLDTLANSPILLRFAFFCNAIRTRFSTFTASA